MEKSETKGNHVRVIGLGQACVDYLGRLTDYPLEDMKAELTDLYMKCGGPASTALVTLSRFGIRTALLGSISDDYFGNKILENLNNQKVDITSLKITPGYTSQFAFICISKESGKRTILWHRGTVPHLDAADVNIQKFPGARFLHLDGLMTGACIEAAKQAKKAGMTVVMDAGTMREGYEELIPLVDVLISSETFARPFFGSGKDHLAILRSIRDWGPEEVVMTLGEKGSIGLNDQGSFMQEAFPVKAVDTTGAGDVYHGAYLYGLLQGWKMRRCMGFASAAAALNCMKIGAQEGIPTLEGVLEWMKKRLRTSIKESGP